MATLMPRCFPTAAGVLHAYVIQLPSTFSLRGITTQVSAIKTLADYQKSPLAAFLPPGKSIYENIEVCGIVTRNIFVFSIRPFKNK